MNEIPSHNASQREVAKSPDTARPIDPPARGTISGFAGLFARHFSIFFIISYATNIIYVVFFLNADNWRFLYSASSISGTLWSTFVFVCLLWVLSFWLRSNFPSSIQSLIPSDIVFSNDFLAETKKRQSDQIDGVADLRSKMDPKKASILDKLHSISEIDDRIRYLKFRATAILIVIGISLVGATLVVIFAGKLTGLDAAAASNIDKLKTEISESNARLFNLNRLRELYSQLEDARKRNATAEIPKLGNDIQSITGLRSGTTAPTWPVDTKTTDGNIAQIEAHLGYLHRLLAGAWEKETTAEHGYSDWRYLAATAVTRVGVVLIIVFLVQILMGLYRYNTRLITYYNSRRDVLLLWDGSSRSLKDLDHIFAPPRIDFGKEPKHPLEDLVQAAGRLRSTKSPTKPSSPKTEVKSPV